LILETSLDVREHADPVDAVRQAPAAGGGVEDHLFEGLGLPAVMLFGPPRRMRNAALLSRRAS